MAKIKRKSPMQLYGEENKRLKAQLAEAEWLIKELESHEGAEGWSEYLRKRLDAYEHKTKGTAQ